VPLILQTFSNLSFVGREASILWVDSILPAISRLLRLRRSCQINARCEHRHIPDARMDSLPLRSKLLTGSSFFAP